MADVTIPAADAKVLADYLRNFHFHGMSGEQDRLIALLDPPTPSLADDLCDAIYSNVDAGRSVIAPVLAVVRSHVEALPVAGMPLAGSDILVRDDVLSLLGNDRMNTDERNH